MKSEEKLVKKVKKVLTKKETQTMQMGANGDRFQLHEKLIKIDKNVKKVLTNKKTQTIEKIKYCLCSFL